MQARYYDPLIGRFYADDPIGFTVANPVMSFNRYLYVNNNPYKYTDPDGKLLWFVPLIGAVAGGGINALAQGLSKGFDNIDYSQVAVAAAVGATGAGIASSIGTTVTNAGLTGVSALAANVGANAAVGAGLGATSAIANAGIDGLQGDSDGTLTLSQLGQSAKDGALYSAAGTAAGALVTNAAVKATGSVWGKANEMTNIGTGVAEAAGSGVGNSGDFVKLGAEKVEEFLK